jgi:VWFA-related protein
MDDKRKSFRARSTLAHLAIVLALSCPRIIALPSAALTKRQNPAGQEPTIRVRSDLVEVRAVVTDRKGQIIDNLSKDDFELLEDNQPQEISFFSITRAAGAGSDGGTNGSSAGRGAQLKSFREQLAEPPARTIVIFVDTMHMPISSTEQVKQALRHFINEQLTGQDMAALVTSAGSLGIAEQLTRDRRLLRYAVERLGMGWASRPTLFTPYLAFQVERGDLDARSVARSIVAQEECTLCTSGMLDAMVEMRKRQILEEAAYQRMAAFANLKEVLGHMAGLPGQRMLALFSDGFTLLDRSGASDSSDLQSAISRAVRSGVAIYSINAGGLQPPWSAKASLRGVFNRLLESYMSQSELDARQVMDSLALNTGGQFYYNTNDLSGALARALDSNRVYYVLAYYLPRPGEREQFRRITVRLKYHPDYIVRTPKGFLPAEAAKASAGEATQQERLMQAIKAPLPATGIGISASADFIESQGNDAQVSVTVHIDGDALQYHEENERFHFAFDLVTALYDSAGRHMQTLNDKVQGNLTPEHFAAVRRNGFQSVRRFALKPGVYQARVGISEEETGLLGTASAVVEVPNLARSKLELSSLLLLDLAGESEMPAPEAQAPVAARSKMVEGIRFYQRDQFCAFGFRVYLNAKGSSYSGLVMRMEFLEAGKTVRQTEWQPVQARKLAEDSKGIAVGGQIRIADFHPGLYELRITVRDPKSKRTAQRAILFGVE